MTVSDATRQQSTGRAAIRSVALPTEHGGWGFLVDPILLGLLVAFSWRGALLAVAAVGVFLIHQPLKVAIKDRLKGRRPPRLVWAERFAGGYAALAIAPVVVLLITTPPLLLLPILAAVPFAAVQLTYDARNRSRNLAPEVSGAVGLAVIAPSIAILGGWTPGMAGALWAILTLRAVAAILYVRARLRLQSGKLASPLPAWMAHGLALLAMAGLTAAGLTPWLAIIAFIVLLSRAVIGLSRFRKDRPARVIGFSEIGYGLLTALLVAAGYGLKL